MMRAVPTPLRPPRPDRRGYTLGGRLALRCAVLGSPASEQAKVCGVAVDQVHAAVRRGGRPLPGDAIDVLARWHGWLWLRWFVRQGHEVPVGEVAEAVAGLVGPWCVDAGATCAIGAQRPESESWRGSAGVGAQTEARRGVAGAPGRASDRGYTR